MTFETTKIALLVAGAIAGAAPLVAGAQQAPTTTTAMSTSPGKAVAVQTTKASAVVVGIDREYRIVTLKTAGAKIFEVVAGPEVKNFDKIQLGDKVHVSYVEALSLELKKSGAGVRSGSERSGAVSAPAGAQPGAAAGRQVTVLADVVGVNQKTHMVTLRGPKGLVDLHVEDPDQLKNIKKGDQVEAVYTEAVAVMVEETKK
jgi:Cu/Ag efflux protein CusF